MRGLRKVGLAVLLLGPVSLAQAHSPVPNGYQVGTHTALHEGVEHVTLTFPDPAQTVHVAHIDPGAPVTVRAVSAHDGIPHRNAEHELPSDMCRRVSCIAGINGDFHDLDSDQPLGGVISDGRMLRSPRAGYDQFTLARDGSLHAGQLGWSGALVASDGTTIPLGGVNVDPRADAAVLYTPAWGRSTPAGAESEFVLRAAGPVGTLGTTSVQIVATRSGSGGIPADGAVLSANGSAGAALRSLAGRVGKAVSPTAQLRLETGVDAVESLGVHPVLLRDGRRVFPEGADGFTRFRNPRTLLGWNPSGEIVMVTVDGRNDNAEGMSLAQAADLLLGLGATDGVNFDGGGGTTFVVAGEVENLPSDPDNPGPPAYPDGHVVAPGHVERMAPNALVIVRKASAPVPPPTSDTTTTTAPGGSGPGTGGSGTDGPEPVLTGRPVPSIGDISSSDTDLQFTVGGAGSDRLVLPAPDTERNGQKGNRKRKDKGKGDGSEGFVDANGNWIPDPFSFPAGTGPGYSALPSGPEEEAGPLLGLGFALAVTVAAGMIIVVGGGISHVCRARRSRPALWL
ncbi:MAG TPA: phosphodiester glycosidase family protein [Acidimicrobiia bacterium]|nr:phosphodiester glycosidase family protein [Acidimicrobiia bacterium]